MVVADMGLPDDNLIAFTSFGTSVISTVTVASAPRTRDPGGGSMRRTSKTPLLSLD
jgi:hypothetical protein